MTLYCNIDKLIKLNNKKHLLLDVIVYLNNLDDLSNIFTNETAYDAIVYATKSVVYGSNLIDSKIFIEKNFDSFISKFLFYFFEIRNEINFDKIIDIQKAETLTDLNERRVCIFNLLLYMVNLICLNSIEFNIRLTQNDGLKSHLVFLKDEYFVKKHLITYINPNELIISDIVLNICLLSRLKNHQLNGDFLFFLISAFDKIRFLWFHTVLV